MCDDLYTYIPYILGTDPMAAEEIGRNPVSNQQVTPEYGDEQADVGRDCRTRHARPNS